MNGKLLILLVAIFAVTTSGYAQDSVTSGVVVDALFHAPLARHGAWVEVNGVGHVWRPSHVEAGWRPYVSGQWVLTENGWFWQSDEPWAWATYHYGRWLSTSDQGWVWVPGKVWAPSWVVWREGGGYIGWAPQAPGDSQGPLNSFVFVNQTRFIDPISPSTVVFNEAVANKTAALSPSQSGGVAVAGPKVEAIQQASGKAVPVAKVQELRAKQEANVPQPAAAAVSEDSKPASAAAPLEPKPSPFIKGESTVEKPSGKSEGQATSGVSLPAKPESVPAGHGTGPSPAALNEPKVQNEPAPKAQSKEPGPLGAPDEADSRHKSR